MPGGIGVLSPERRSKSVDFGQAHGRQFALQLAGNRQVCFSPEEILFIIYISILCQREVLKVQCGDFKGFTSAFSIGSSNNRGMYIEKSFVVEIAMYRKCQGMSYPKHGSKSGCPYPQMRIFPQKLQGMFFWLDRVFLHIGIPQNFHLDRKSTRLNSSHVKISYAVFCLKKKNI